MYPMASRDYLLAQTGGEAYGRFRLGGAGALEYRAYGGTIFVPIPASSAETIRDVQVPYLYGARLMWATPLDGLQLGGSAQWLRMNLDYAFSPERTARLKADGTVPADFSGQIQVGLPVTLWVASAEYAANDLLLAFEYGRWIVDIESPVPIAPDAVQERFYGMMSYRVTPWFSPGFYYSLLYPDVDRREGREQYQHDFAATVRYDLNANWLVKLEGHVMHGTASLDVDLNGGRARKTLVKDWGVFLFKTTAYF
jgi:hypothetical protein